jgi:hypothetical protein
MSTPDPVPAPAAIPWYKSHVLQGILVAVIAQGILRLKAQFGIDLSQYAAFGLDANGIAMWIMDIISAAALSYAARARVSKPMPAVTANKTQAAAINAVNPAGLPTPVIPPTVKPEGPKI